MRGEDSFILDWLLKHDGSPPHARGRLDKTVFYSYDRRITPACAGKTASMQNADLNYRDHPRMRGEDS